MSTPKSFLQRPLRRALATAAIAAACGVALPAMAQPSGGAGPGWYGAGMGHGMHHRGGFGAGEGFGPMAGRGMQRALDRIGASAEQKAQIRQIMDAARADLRAQRETRLELARQAQSIFAAPTVDARAAEALRQQMLARHDAASKRMLQAMLDAANVLTPEQRKALAERMSQRRAMMQRHRAERNALDAAPAKR